MTKIKIIFSILFLFIVSCKTNPTVELINKSLDSSIKVTQISMKKFAKDYKSYHGKYVQIEGVFYHEFENVSICDSRQLNSNCFWLDFNDSIINHSDLLNKATTKKIILKGEVDTTSKGHLSDYLAIIRNVYYFKEK